MSAKVTTKPEPLRDSHTIAVRSGVTDGVFKGLVAYVHDLLFVGDVALKVSALIGNRPAQAMAKAPARDRLGTEFAAKRPRSYLRILCQARYADTVCRDLAIRR